MDKFNQLKAVVASIEEDVKKFYQSSNSAAGTRVRNGMQKLKVLAQEIRTEVSDKKNSTK